MVILGVISLFLHLFLIENLEFFFLLAILVTLGVWTILEFLEGVTSVNEEIVRILMIFIGGVLLYFGLHLECILLMIMFGFAELLEDYAKELAERSLRKTLELMPRTVRVIEDGTVVMKGTQEVKTGDIVVVGRGDRIPVDGIVIEGLKP